MFFSGQLARFHHWQHRDLWAFCKWVALSVLVGSTVRSYLAWLKDTGRLTALFEDGWMRWARV